jgi:hypothetical protein
MSAMLVIAGAESTTLEVPRRGTAVATTAKGRAVAVRKTGDGCRDHGSSKAKGKTKRVGKKSAKKVSKSKAAAAAAATRRTTRKSTAKPPLALGNGEAALETRRPSASELLAAALQQLAELEGLIAASETQEHALEEEAANVKLDMDSASARVEEAVQKEDLALEKIMAARLAHICAARETAEAMGSRDDAERSATMLKLEMQSRKKVADIDQAKHVAQKAAEAAKQTFAESKRKEKEAREEMRSSCAKGRGGKVLSIADANSAMATMSGAQRKSKADEKEASRREAAEFREIEKMRAERAKLHERAVRKAAGLLGRDRGSGSSTSRPSVLRRPAVLADSMQPCKAARVQGAD